MKKLTESQVKNIKEKLIKFQNEVISENRIKKDNAWYLVVLHIMVLKILHIYLMRMKINMKISDICLMKM